jgi:urea transport system substrate-binding protein
MVTGRLPFDNVGPSTVAILQAAIKGDAPRVAEHAPQLSAQVAELIQQLLARQPEDRPASAADLVARLRRLEHQEGKTLVDTRVLTVPDGPTRRKARRADLIGIGLGAVAILAALVVGGIMAYQKLWPGKPDNDTSGPGTSVVGEDKPPLKVGLLFSMTGNLAFHELHLLDAAHLAIEEINAAGGVLGHKLEAIDEDGESNDSIFARQAAKLIEKDDVAVLVGCWTSASRKRVAEVCGKHDRLLFYPCSFEGLEDSPHVIYLGGTPNQTFIPLVQWAFTALRKRRFFLVGSDGIFSHALHEILEHELKDLGATVAGKRYVVLGDTAVADIVDQIKKSRADIIINSMDGLSNTAFFTELRKAKVTPKTVPTAWLSISEPELSYFKAPEIVDDYSAGCYFGSIDLPSNREFLARFRKRFGKNKRVNDPMATVYTGVYLWKKAVEEAGSIQTNAVREALRGLSIDSPEGRFRMGPKLLYAWRTARVGRVVREHNDSLPSFEVVFQSPRPVPPEPFPAWRTRKEWDAFLEKLYVGWGNAWEKH